MVVALLSIATVTVFSIYEFVFNNKTTENENKPETENHIYNEDSVYPMKSNPSGICLIINNYEVKGKRSRNGSKEDVEKLQKLFTYLNFKVNVEENKTAAEITQNLNKTRQLNELKTHDALVLVVMSHGDSHDIDPYGIILGSDGESVTITEIYENFNNENCRNLIGKPKLFFFQSCRGGRRNLVADGDGPRPLRKNTDIILSFSTVYNYESIRDTLEGAWYITSLCNVLKADAQNTEIVELLRRVDKDVENNIAGRRTQTTEFHVIGFSKDFYFNVNSNFNFCDLQRSSQSA